MRWQKLHKILEGETTAIKEHKKELFGSLLIEDTPYDFDLISSLKKLNMWRVPEGMDDNAIHALAKAIAHNHLEGIMDILRRHDDIMERRLKDRSSKRNK